MQAAAQDLDAQVVFLVDHDRDGFVLADRDASRAFGGRVRLADQMPLDQQLPIDFRRLLEIDVEASAARVAASRIVSRISCSSACRWCRVHAVRKRMPGHVARQPDARGDDDLAHRPAAAEPFAGVIGEIDSFIDAVADVSCDCQSESIVLTATRNCNCTFLLPPA